MINLFTLFVNSEENGYGFAFCVWTKDDDSEDSIALLAITTKFFEAYGIHFRFRN